MFSVLRSRAVNRGYEILLKHFHERNPLLFVCWSSIDALLPMPLTYTRITEFKVAYYKLADLLSLVSQSSFD